MGDTVTKRDDALRKAPFPVLEMMLEFRDAERADPAWMEAARRHFDEGDKSIDIWRLLAKRYGKSRSNHPSYPCAPLSLHVVASILAAQAARGSSSMTAEQTDNFLKVVDEFVSGMEEALSRRQAAFSWDLSMFADFINRLSSQKNLGLSSVDRIRRLAERTVKSAEEEESALEAISSQLSPLVPAPTAEASLEVARKAAKRRLPFSSMRKGDFQLVLERTCEYPRDEQVRILQAVAKRFPDLLSMEPVRAYCWMKDLDIKEPPNVSGFLRTALASSTNPERLKQLFIPEMPDPESLIERFIHDYLEFGGSREWLGTAIHCIAGFLPSLIERVPGLKDIILERPRRVLRQLIGELKERGKPQKFSELLEKGYRIPPDSDHLIWCMCFSDGKWKVSETLIDSRRTEAGDDDASLAKLWATTLSRMSRVFAGDPGNFCQFYGRFVEHDGPIDLTMGKYASPGDEEDFRFVLDYLSDTELDPLPAALVEEGHMQDLYEPFRTRLCSGPLSDDDIRAIFRPSPDSLSYFKILPETNSGTYHNSSDLVRKFGARALGLFDFRRPEDLRAFRAIPPMREYERGSMEMPEALAEKVRVELPETYEALRWAYGEKMGSDNLYDALFRLAGGADPPCDQEEPWI